jgi:hypothetical protein
MAQRLIPPPVETAVDAVEFGVERQATWQPLCAWKWKARRAIDEQERAADFIKVEYP